jgi:hypothetical protein
MMAGISNTFVFMTGNNRAARNKLSNMGGIMSSSEELMQAAMPVVKEVMKSVEPQPMPKEMPPQNFNIGGLATAARAAPGIAKAVPGVLKKTISGAGQILSSPLQTGKKAIGAAIRNPIKTIAGGTIGAYLFDRFTKEGEKKEGEEFVEHVTGTSDKEDATAAFNTLLATAGISSESDGKRKSTNELVKEFKRVAKNTAIADPGSFAERFGKSMLTGIATDLATRGGTSAKASTYTPERLRQNIISNLAKDPSITAILKKPGGQQQVEDMVQQLMSMGLGMNPDQNNISDAPQQARGPDGTVYTLVNGKYLDADGNEYKEQT